jgi:hypothetical protein
VQRFEQHDFSCKDELRPGRPVLSLRPGLSRFLAKYPFANAEIIATQFGIARDSVKMILARELNLNIFSRRWLSDQLSDAQRKSLVEFSQGLLQILENCQEMQFDGIVT